MTTNKNHNRPNVPNSTDKGNTIRNVPPLRFPEFSGEWENITIREACSEFQSGKNIKAEMINDQGLYPVYGGNGLRGFTGSYNHDGDYILIGRQGALCGNVRKVTGKTYVTEHAIAVCASKEHETTFLQHLFQKMRLGQYSDQSAQPGLAVNKLLRLNINVPSKIEQGKIAKILSLIDERIATQNKIIEKYESLIRGLNNHLCQQHGNEIETSFADLGVSYSGLSGKTAADFGSGKPFITYLNVYSNNVIDETSYQYVRMGNNEKQSIVRYGDVLFTLSPYLSYYISTTQFRKFIYPFAQGSTRFNLCKADFEKATIKLPTLENQKRIYKALKSLSDKIMVEKATLERYSRQKQYLLRQMFI